MEICDRCYHRGDYRPSTKKIITNTYESFGLCESCYNDFEVFLEGNQIEIEIKKTKKGGRPPKK